MGAVMCSWSSSVGWVRLQSYSGTVSENWRPDALPSPLCGKCIANYEWIYTTHTHTVTVCVWSSHIWVLYSEYSEYMYTQTLSKQKMMMLLQSTLDWLCYHGNDCKLPRLKAYLMVIFFHQSFLCCFFLLCQCLQHNIKTTPSLWEWNHIRVV